MAMIDYQLVFEDLVQFQVTTEGDDDLPDSTYVFVESYCDEPECDCRRVLLHVVDVNAKRVAASIAYAFEPPVPPFDEEKQWYLDPINPQSIWSKPLLGLFEELILKDGIYRQHLVDHYETWKEVVRNPGRPAHEKLRSLNPQGAALSRPRRAAPRPAPKVGRTRRRRRPV